MPRSQPASISAPLSQTRATPLPWLSLSDYLKARLERSGLSLRGLAQQVKIDPSHLSRLMSGTVAPRPETCLRLAAHFGDPPQVVLHLAGYLDLGAIGADVEVGTLAALLARDPMLQRLCRLYAALATPEAQRTLVQTLEATVGPTPVRQQGPSPTSVFSGAIRGKHNPTKN